MIFSDISHRTPLYLFHNEPIVTRATDILFNGDGTMTIEVEGLTFIVKTGDAVRWNGDSFLSCSLETAQITLDRYIKTETQKLLNLRWE